MEFDDNDVDDDMDEIIGRMQVSMIKERTSEEELELVIKYYNMLDNMLFTNKGLQQYSKYYLVSLRKELLDVFETYKKMFSILLGELTYEEQVTRGEYQISILNKELCDNGKYSSDFDFFHNSHTLFSSIKKLIDSYDQFETENNAEL